MTAPPPKLALEPSARLPLAAKAAFVMLGALAAMGLALGGYDPLFALLTLGLLAALVGGLLFFDVRALAIIGYPLAFFANHALVQLALTAAVTGSFGLALLYSRRQSVRVPYAAAWAAFVIALLGGFAQADNPGKGLYVLLHLYLQPLLVFIILSNLDLALGEIRTALTGTAVLSALIGWISLGMFLTEGQGRVLFGGGSLNLNVAFIALSLPYALLRLIDARDTLEKVLWTWVFVGIGAGIVVSQTRGMLLFTLAAILYLGWKDRTALKVALPTLALSVVAAPVMLYSRVAMLFGHGTVADWSAVGRVEIWLNSLELLPRYLLTGMGLEDFRAVYHTTYPLSLFAARHPHNIYLHLLFEMGLVGVMSFFYVVFSIFGRAHRLLAERAAGAAAEEPSRLMLPVNASVVGMLIAGLFDAYLRSPRVAVMFWMLLAFQLRLMTLARLEGDLSADADSVHK